jgi:hypothetical protein
LGVKHNEEQDDDVNDKIKGFYYLCFSSNILKDTKRRMNESVAYVACMIENWKFLKRLVRKGMKGRTK